MSIFEEVYLSCCDSADFDSLDLDILFEDIEKFNPIDNNFSCAFQDYKTSTVHPDFTRPSIEQTMTAKKARILKKSPASAKDKNAYRQRHLLSHSPSSTITSVPTNDIRRDYTLMFTNTLNSQDFSLFLSFLSKYTSPDFVFTQTHNGELVDSYRHPSVIECNGLKLAAQYWFNKLQLLPDAAYSLFSTNVHTYTDCDESKVVGQMQARAHYVFDVAHSSVVDVGVLSSTTFPISTKVEDVSVGCKRSFDAVATTPTSTEPQKCNCVVDMHCINTTAIENYLSRARLMSKPIYSGLNGQLVMYLDVNKRIKRMEFALVPQAVQMQKILYF